MALSPQEISRIDNIINDHQNIEDEDMKITIQKLKDYRDGKAKIIRENEQNRFPELSTSLSLNIRTRDELHMLDKAVQKRAIASLAFKHHLKEVKDGHVINHKKTPEYRHAYLPEVDCHLFGTSCPPYNRFDPEIYPVVVDEISNKS
jgi:hypothetical protein